MTPQLLDEYCRVLRSNPGTFIALGCFVLLLIGAIRHKR
jgi:hypothetical protein